MSAGVTPKMLQTRTRRGRSHQRRITVHHATALETADVMTLAGIPVTTVARTLVDLAGILPTNQLMKAATEAEHQHTFDLNAVESAMKRVRGRRGPGYANLRAVLAELRHRGTQLTRSVLEDRFVALVESHELPRPRMNATIEGVEVDAVWHDERLAVELDGFANHSGRAVFQRDRDKGNVLMEAGWTVLRFTHDDVVRRPAETAARLHRLLERRAAA